MTGDGERSRGYSRRDNIPARAAKEAATISSANAIAEDAAEGGARSGGHSTVAGRKRVSHSFHPLLRDKPCTGNASTDKYASRASGTTTTRDTGYMQEPIFRPLRGGRYEVLEGVNALPAITTERGCRSAESCYLNHLLDTCEGAASRAEQRLSARGWAKSWCSSPACGHSGHSCEVPRSRRGFKRRDLWSTNIIHGLAEMIRGCALPACHRPSTAVSWWKNPPDSGLYRAERRLICPDPEDTLQNEVSQ
jgi:hypothetical protein